MPRKPTLNQARSAALRGETSTAIAALQAFADAGDASASASLAELLAFSDRWNEVIPHAGRLIENPTSVYAGNVFNDMIRLLGRAGQETGQWQQIADIAGGAWGSTDRTEERVHVRERHFKILNRLKSYAECHGEAPHELLQISGAGVNFPQADRDASYQNAVHEATFNNKTFRQDPDNLAAYLFSIAVNSNQPDDVLRIYHSGTMPANFNNAVHVAHLLVEHGDLDGGWEVLWKHMSLWWPVDKAQVAPVSLLTDALLKTLLNSERCRQILALPRGPEAKQVTGD